MHFVFTQMNSLLTAGREAEVAKWMCRQWGKIVWRFRLMHTCNTEPRQQKSTTVANKLTQATALYLKALSSYKKLPHKYNSSISDVNTIKFLGFPSLPPQEQNVQWHRKKCNESMDFYVGFLKICLQNLRCWKSPTNWGLQTQESS